MSQYDGDDVNVKGDDGSETGLKVSAITDLLGVKRLLVSSDIPPLNSSLELVDMNAATGGVDRNTSITAAAGWTRVYSYTGFGLLLGVLVTIENLAGTDSNYWSIRIVVDSSEIFNATAGTGLSTRELTKSSVYNWSSTASPSPIWSGITIVQDTFRFEPPSNHPIYFSSLVEVFVRRTGSTKEFRAGLASLLKQG